MDDFSDFDAETQEMLTVQKPSNVFYVCLIIICVLVFLFALLLIALNVTGSKDKLSKSKDNSQPTVSSEVSEPDESSLSNSDYFAEDFVGVPFFDAKMTLDGEYTIIMGDTIRYSYPDYHLVLVTSDPAPSDDALIAQVIVEDDGVISPELSADMPYSKIAEVLSVSTPAPVLNSDGSNTFVLEQMINDSVKATFIFDAPSADAIPTQVILQNDSLVSVSNQGTVIGIDSDSYLTLRSKPNADSTDLAHLSNQDKVNVYDEITDDNGTTWYKVIFSGTEGYVNAEYVVKDNEVADAIDSDIYFNADNSDDDSDDSSEE